MYKLISTMMRKRFWKCNRWETLALNLHAALSYFYGNRWPTTIALYYYLYFFR